MSEFWKSIIFFIATLTCLFTAMALDSDFNDTFLRKIIRKVLVLGAIVLFVFGVDSIGKAMHESQVEQVGQYKYQITVPSGKYSHTHYTKDYTFTNGSISFWNEYGEYVISPQCKISTNTFYQGSNN